MHGWAIDIVPGNGSAQDFRDFLEKVRNNKDLVKFLQDNKIGILRETNKTALSKTKGTGIHLHVGKDNSAIKDLDRLLNGESPYLGVVNSNDWYLGLKQGGIIKAQNGFAINSILGKSYFTPYVTKSPEESEEIVLEEDVPAPYVKTFNLDSTSNTEEPEFKSEQEVISDTDVSSAEESDTEQEQEVKSETKSEQAEIKGSAFPNVPKGKVSLETFVAAVKPVVEAALDRAGIDRKFAPMLVANMSIETGNTLSGSYMSDAAFNLSGIHGINQDLIRKAGFKYYDTSFSPSGYSNDYKIGTIVRGAGLNGRDAIYVPHKKRKSWPTQKSSSW